MKSIGISINRFKSINPDFCFEEFFRHEGNSRCGPEGRGEIFIHIFWLLYLFQIFQSNYPNFSAGLTFQGWVRPCKALSILESVYVCRFVVKCFSNLIFLFFNACLTLLEKISFPDLFYEESYHIFHLFKICF